MPAVAGQFYEIDSELLKKRIESCFLHPVGPGKIPPIHDDKFGHIFGIISPHAGYMYSGPVAAHGYYNCSSHEVDLVVIIGPNHHGLGSGIATLNGGIWNSPLGNVEIDGEAARLLSKESILVDFSEEAHRLEHSIEVQVPFLQYCLKNEFKILPISMMMQDKKTSIELGEVLATVFADRNVLFVASSDFTHYEEQSSACSKDSELINAILALDVDRQYETLQRLNISACGYGAMTAVITALRKMGASHGNLLKYATSGDTSGDYSSVVGYSSILIT